MFDAIFKNFDWPQYIALGTGAALVVIMLAAIIKDGVRSWRHRVAEDLKDRNAALRERIKSLQVERDEYMRRHSDIALLLRGEQLKVQELTARIASYEIDKEAGGKAYAAHKELMRREGLDLIPRTVVPDDVDGLYAAAREQMRRAGVDPEPGVFRAGSAAVKLPCRVVGSRRVINPDNFLDDGTDILNGLAERLYQIETFLCENQARPFNETVVRQ